MSENALDKWVHTVNKLAVEIEEDANSMHPSAWKEALGPLHEQYRKLAQRGPKGEKQ